MSEVPGSTGSPSVSDSFKAKGPPLGGGGRPENTLILWPPAFNFLIVISGGRSSSSGFLQSTEVLDLTTNSLVYAGDLNSPRIFFHMAIITRDGQQLLLAFGGYTGSSTLNSVEQFNPSNNSWTLVPTSMEEARREFGAVVVPRELACPTT